jgi:hypothetical protein
MTGFEGIYGDRLEGPSFDLKGHCINNFVVP